MELIKYTHHADGTHEFKLEGDNAYAVDQLLPEFKTIITGDDAKYVIFEMTTLKMGTMRYFANELRAFMRARQDQTPLFIAIIISAGMVDLTSSLLKTILERETVQYFTQSDKARTWLRIEKQKQARL
mgnify:CR=1 FL=1